MHEKEVYFPEVRCCPFAEARDVAIRSLKSPDAAIPILPEVPLPFAIEAGETERKETYRVEVPKSTTRFQITNERINRFGPTPGCEACIFNPTLEGREGLTTKELEEMGVYKKKHTKACREKFIKLLDEEK